MKFSQLLENINNDYNAFVLGMIYGWPVIDIENKVLLAYSSYKSGTRIRDNFGVIGMDIFYEAHEEKLKNFLHLQNNEIVNNKELNKFNLDKNLRLGPGVSIIVELDMPINDVVPEIFVLSQIEKALIDSTPDAKNKFILGLMDSRGSLDFTGKYIAIDIAQKEKPEIVKRKINRYYDLLGTIFNYNPRILQANSSKKNDQFRIDLRYFIGHFGLFTPFKIEYYKKEFKDNAPISSDGYIFKDKNFENLEITTNTLKSENLAINEFAIKINSQNLTSEEKLKLVQQYRAENNIYDSDDEILYSSANVKNQAKIDAEFKCEFDYNHITFIAKSDNKQYVEAHHLIPFSKRKEFDLNIDVSENLVCLCPNCHRKIHLAKENDRNMMLSEIFSKRENLLHAAGIKTKIEELYNYYK